jgi:hypothetical protein
MVEGMDLQTKKYIDNSISGLAVILAQSVFNQHIHHPEVIKSILDAIKSLMEIQGLDDGFKHSLRSFYRSLETLSSGTLEKMAQD